MRICLFVKFNADDQHVDALIGILQAAKSMLLSAPGCASVEVMHNENDRNQILLSEIWKSKEAHENFVATTESDSLGKLRPFLKSDPEVEIFAVH